MKLKEKSFMTEEDFSSDAGCFLDGLYTLLYYEPGGCTPVLMVGLCFGRG